MKCFNDYEVNISVLKSNAQNIKNLIGKDKKFCAVVKANAYGIGLQTVCESLKGIADYFACACIKEALAIRLFDKSTPILILGLIDDVDADIVARNNISISVGSIDQLIKIANTSKDTIKVHLQVNTGMNRFGFRSVSEFKKALRFIQDHKQIVLEGVYSHFATKKNDIEFINRQYLRFLQFKKFVNDSNVIFHLANSYGVIHSSKLHFDMVRSGFLLYGFAENNINNKPVINIYSHVISIFNCKKGDTIGYDRTYKINKSTRIAIVPIGYADGMNRKLSNNFKVIMNNKKYPIVGRICMDVFMVNIGNDDIDVGDKVTILGGSGECNIALNDYANAIGTSPYEVLCGFNYRRMNYIVKN